MKAVVLISQGIDSPVAAHMMKRKGFELIFLNLGMGKSEAVVKLRDKVSPGSELITKDFLTKIREISEKTKDKYTCLLCKRAMFREAQKTASEKGAEFIVTGENLGQVASQTLENMRVIESAVSLPVLRPLLCFDKNEIINIAKRIGTYDISTVNNKSCPFVPHNPATKARINIIEKEESHLSL